MFPVWVIIGEYPPERVPLAALLGIVGWVVLLLVADWRMFEKARRPGWKSVVPFYNVIVFLDIVDRSRWWLLLLLLPLVNFVFFVIVSVDLARAFGKSRAFAIGLAFFPSLFMAILAFGDAQYQYEEA